MYKVFIDDQAFYLTFNVKIALLDSNVMMLEKKTFLEIKNTLKSTKKNVLLNFKSHKELKKWLNFEFNIISAGGGLVLNKKEEILFIFRHGKWDLPKGKIEKGEKKKTAAIREVEEECGITAPALKKFITTTYHVYTYKGNLALKESFWYFMNYNGDETLIPQEEEGITKVEWIAKNDLQKVFANTFPSIVDVLKCWV